ncbi:site-specific integrase [Falsihalocynthiibacter arcticus]|uniref:site-specific integrase n=1 Tax=Falsihalocynthiibacter arcticus TaxID=1579316 RepID=UPI0012E71138|nr:site-specific integrase [Falsihalocynthiibacter arcticus]
MLPKEPICVFPTSRQYDALPAHIDAVLVEMAHIAGSERDLVAGKDSETIKDVTRAHYLSALRHHIRLLTQCPAEPAQGYDNPVEDLMTVNDVAGLFSIDHLKATIRQTQAVEHLQGTIRQVSAYDYYSEILVVLSRNGIDTAEIYKTFKSSIFLRQGKDLGRGMTEASKVWCASLMNTPDRERRFTNMHRILMAQAEKIFSHAADEGRPLLSKERTQIRKLGVCAATSAIEWAGRPIRLSNVLELRLRGSRRNFFTPTKAQPDYAFHLFADETKAGKSGERTALRKELYGPQVLAWYLRKVRPLFEHADDNLYLFPAVTTPGKRLGNGLFDTWFQSAASSAGLPMSFHRWRHGYATLLLASDWNNLQLAADMLGNTVPVCAQKYAWLDKPKLIKAGQDELIKRMRALK